jgi:hypothetical protein
MEREGIGFFGEALLRCAYRSLTKERPMRHDHVPEILGRLGVGRNLTHVKTLTSAVTTAWGVNWDEVYIARDVRPRKISDWLVGVVRRVR